ncbi:MAG: DUF354 domain-containing protein, partial [Sedimentisphaerales bacterium]|nr:DUF354 domain-containing protein [Sedimentisphaerales bacterium]
MRILVDIAHPAQVHFFRHAIRAWQDHGHTVAVTALDKEVTLGLLEHFGIAYRQVNTPRLPAWLRLVRMLGRDGRLLQFCREFRPDVLTAVGGIWAAQAGFLLRRPVVLWDDTEHHKWGHRAAWPFATQIHCPDCYKLPPVRKQRLYAGCHELAYLHPKRFTPQSQIMRELGIDPTERYCVVRLVAWGAQHDVGQHGIEIDKRTELIRTLAERTRVYITSEASLPEELAPYRLCIPPHQIHHVLAFASLVVTEGATMASESALLATPTI